ncbi:hypothetical protein KBD34_00925 [Patescibacteria group bacterium]|nr:hypothetical protein [Patescibacteria group bacterium]
MKTTVFGAFAFLVAVAGCALEPAYYNTSRMPFPMDDSPEDAAPMVVADAAVTPDAALVPALPPGELRVQQIVTSEFLRDRADQELIRVRFFVDRGFAPVRLKMYRFILLPGGPNDFAPPVQWSLEGLTLSGTAALSGFQRTIDRDPTTPARLVVTIAYERAIMVDSTGVDAIFVGRTTAQPASGDRLTVLFIFNEGRYSYASSQVGALTPDIPIATVSGGLLSGPHLYYGTGHCTTPRPATYGMPGNMTEGIVLWTPDSSSFNEFDCLDGRAMASWRNVITPLPSMGPGPASNGFSQYLRMP